MTYRADTVIVGAGIVGCVAARQLAAAGVDVVLLDQGPLDDPGGSTSHAPGLVFQTSSSQLLCRLAQETTALYRSLHTPEAPVWHEVGSVEVARASARAEWIVQRAGHARSWGLSSRLVTPDEVHDLLPLVDPDMIVGGYHVESDGLVKALTATRLLREQIQALGAELRGETPVVGLRVERSRVRAVETARGTIEAEHVLLAPGIWGRKLGSLAGLRLPIQPMQHLVGWTEPLRELAGESREIRLPLLRDQDRAMYFRQRFEVFGIGSYAHDPLAIDAADFHRHPAGHEYAEVPAWPEGHFARALEATRELLPAVGRAKIADTLNGVFSFTPDGLPLIGETRQVRGLWLAIAVWIMHAGGAGRLVAELMTGREPFVDPREADCNRFLPFARTSAYVRARGDQQYREVYDPIHPALPIAVPRGLRRSPAHAYLDDLGAVWIEAAGWERPRWLEANERLPEPEHAPRRDAWSSRHWSRVIGKEHRATREGVGLFDLTPFTKLEVSGPGALAFLERVATNRIDRAPGRIVYTPLLDEHAGVVCDLTITRLAEDRFWVVVGSSTGAVDSAWLELQRSSDEDVAIVDRTSAEYCFGVWGPRARELVSRVTDADLSTDAFPYMRAREIELRCAPVRALRISYAGELGWEVYGASELGAYVWEMLWEAGRDLGVTAVGMGAFDSLRLEKGYRFAGVDLRREWTADEAGLGFAVATEKGDFVGRDALLRRRREGLRAQLCCLTLSVPDRAPLGGEPVVSADDVVGYVTSASFGYTVGESLAYAYVPPSLAATGTSVEIDLRGRLVPATVCEEPVFDPRGERLRA